MKKKILVIKLWAIGEVASSTACIGRLKAAFPESDIDFLVGNNAKDIVISNPDIKKVINIDEEIFLKPRPIRLISLIRELRRERFDMILTLHYVTPFSFFALLVGAVKRLGFKRPGSFSFNTADIVSNGATKTRILEYLRILELLGISTDDKDAKIVLYPKEEDVTRVASLMKERGLQPKKFIILSPTGGENPAASRLRTNTKTKVWPLEYYKKLYELITENLDYKVVIIGGRIEAQRASCIKGEDGRNIVDLTGKMNLREAMLLAKEAAISVTNDSGPMFILIASGAPVIAIFGPTDPCLLCPPSDNLIIMKEDLACSPCYDGSVFPNKVKDCRDPICMKNITPEMVFQRICEVLGWRR